MSISCPIQANVVEKEHGDEALESKFKAVFTFERIRLWPSFESSSESVNVIMTMVFKL